MSAENVEATRRIYEGMARGDFWVLREFLHPDVVWEWSASLAGLTGVSEYHGIEGVEAATRDFFKAFDLFRQEALELIDSGDEVLAINRHFARPKGSEREFEGIAAEVWTFRDGKVIRHRLFDTPEEGRAAIGGE